MSALSQTFIKCCLLLLQTKSVEDARATQLASVIDTLDLSPSNLAVALIYLQKYQRNTVNTLDNAETDTLHYYMIVAALVLANKYINDQSYTLKTWHSILTKCLDFRPTLGMLNQLEQNFLASLDFVLNTKHDAGLWSIFRNLNTAHISQLRMAVSNSECVTPCEKETRLTPPAMHYGLATPPLSFTVYASPMSYASAMSPLPAVHTPVSMLSGGMPMSMAPLASVALHYLQMLPLPLLHLTPQRAKRSFGSGDEWENSKKRRLAGPGTCAAGSYALAPAFAACYNNV